MKIIADDKIPFLRGALEQVAEVVYMPGKEITPEIAKDADALITRTRTKCNKSLLKDSSIKIIASATIGYDHIDTAYCEAQGIEWTNAPGCNSSSVAQYITCALLNLAVKHNLSLKDKTLGIVGVGNVGSKVAKVGEALGMRVLLNDPPRAREEGQGAFCDLEKIKDEADFITMHVPLNPEGKDKTFHLADETFFNSLEKKPFFINSSRGEVADTESLKTALKNNLISGLVIDVWEKEPDIDLELLSLADIATPHIAGYSADGKANGTSMSVNAVSKFLGLGLEEWRAEGVPVPENTNIVLSDEGLLEKTLSNAVSVSYDIMSDDARLRNSPETFEKQRGDYPLRREFPVFSLSEGAGSKEATGILQKLGVRIK
jgi:erythronate-4-phosphate dehydrogenase